MNNQLNEFERTEFDENILDLDSARTGASVEASSPDQSTDANENSPESSQPVSDLREDGDFRSLEEINSLEGGDATDSADLSEQADSGYGLENDSVATPLPATEAEAHEEMPKKKSKTPVFVVAMAIAGALLVGGGASAYYLWWQNPENILNDSLIKFMNSEKLDSSGTVKVTSEGTTVLAAVKMSYDGDDSSADINLTVENDELGAPLKIGLAGVYAGDGSAYVKASGLRSAIDKALDSFFDSRLSQTQQPNGAALSEEELAEAKRMYADEINRQINPVVDKIDNQWIKIDTSKVAERDEAASCTIDVMNQLAEDKAMQEEIISSYRNNRFIMIQDEVGQRDGLTGYQIVLEGDELESRIKGFSDSVKSTEFGKKIEACEKNSNRDSQPDEPKEAADEISQKLVLWIDKSSRTLRGLDYQMESKDNSTTSIELKFNPEYSGDVVGPANSKDAEEVIRELEQMFGGFFQPQPAPSATQQPNVQGVVL